MRDHVVMDLLRQGNPADEVPDSIWAEPEVDYLASIQDRSRLMSDRSSNGSSRVRTAWLAAAALVVVAGVVAVLTSNNEKAAPELAAPTTQATTTTAALDDWEETEILFFAGPAGQYRTGSTFFAQFRVDLPDGWARTFPEFAGIVEVSPTPGACEEARTPPSCAGLLTVIDSFQLDVDTTVDFLRSREAVTTTEPEPVTVGGAEGVVFGMTTDQVGATIQPLNDGGRFVIQPDRDISVYVVDVDGTPVTILVDSPTGGSFFPEAAAVLESIEWRALRN